MPKNKNAFLRYRIIDEIIRPRPCSRQSLLRQLNQRLEEKGQPLVSAETLSLDIRSLRQEFNAPIRHTRNRGYHYTEPGFRLFRASLNKEESSALDFAIDMLGSKEHVELVHEARQIISGVVRKVTPETTNRSIVRSGMSLHVKGVEFLTTLYAAIREKRSMTIRYHSRSGGKSKQHIFSPYVLREYRGLWYVVGHSDRNDAILILALDRIEGMEPTVGVSYKETPEFSTEEYFRYSFGITQLGGGSPARIRFWVNPTSWYFLKIQPLHATQRVIEETAEGCTLEIEVYWCVELMMTLLGHGASLKVLDPPEIVNEIKAQVAEMAGYYGCK